MLDPDDISITSVRFGTCLNSFDGFASIPDVPYPLYPVVHTVPSFLVSLYIDILLLCLLHFYVYFVLVLFCLLYLLALVVRFHCIPMSILFHLILVLQSGFLLPTTFGCAIPPCTFTFTFNASIYFVCVI